MMDGSLVLRDDEHVLRFVSKFDILLNEQDMNHLLLAEPSRVTPLHLFA